MWNVQVRTEYILKCDNKMEFREKRNTVWRWRLNPRIVGSSKENAVWEISLEKKIFSLQRNWRPNPGGTQFLCLLFRWILYLSSSAFIQGILSTPRRKIGFLGWWMPPIRMGCNWTYSFVRMGLMEFFLVCFNCSAQW